MLLIEVPFYHPLPRFGPVVIHVGPYKLKGNFLLLQLPLSLTAAGYLGFSTEWMKMPLYFVLDLPPGRTT